MKKIAITTKHDLVEDKQVLVDLLTCLSAANKEIFLDENAERNLEKNKIPYQKYDFRKKVDLLIVVGGDGTVLRAIRALEDLKTPIFGINMGRLGFLVGTPPAKMKSALASLWKDKFTVDWRMMLKVEIVRQKKVFKTFRALNEVSISQTVSRMIELSAAIDGYNIATFRADGFIIATPTGSTAHSLSAGGPILHSKMEAFILTPISPHSFNQKPIVITPEKVITVEPASLNREDMVITIDGQISEALQKGDSLRVSRYETRAQFLRLPAETFFKTIKTKLGWGKNFNART